MTSHTKTTTPALLDTALSYAARGWYVFPCHTPTAGGCSCRQNCGRIGKHPRTRNGLKDATTATAIIQRWWRQWPAANIAIATGAGSGLVVLDEDSYKGGDNSRVDLERSYSPLPETVQQLTGGGGVQYLFAHPGPAIKNGVEILGAGLDIRGDGGYVIAPPSLHASGKRYAWELTHHPDETPLAPMPDWLRVLCQDTTRREAVAAGEPIPQHHRNDTLFKLGCAMRGRGFPHAAILGALQAINTTQCQPPLEPAEVETIAASCAKYEAGAGETAAAPGAHQRQNGTATPAAHGSEAPSTPQTARPVVVTMSEVQAKPITWLWWPYLAISKLAMLDGDPGIGKPRS
jgi:putative DNA primase/helicase